MKSTITAAALTTLAFATPAMAQDAGSTGVYGAVHAGLNIPSKQPFTLYDAVEAPEDEGDAGLEADIENAFEIGSTLGYDFGMIRADIDVSYSRAKLKNLTLKTLGGETVPANTLEEGIGGTIENDFIEFPEDYEIEGNTVLSDDLGKVRRLSAMANVWFDIPVGNGIAPYVGGGLGMQRLKLNGEGKSTFAWQLGAGVSVPLSRNVAVSADYRYRQQKGFTLNASDDEDGEEFSFGSDLQFGKIKSSSIFLSLRANFGGTNSGSTRSDGCSGPC